MRFTGAAVFLVSLLAASAAWARDARMVPVTIDGQTVRLEMRIYRPATAGPAPTLVFNHGSTGRGSDPRIFTRPIDYPEIAQVFVQRGWAVVMPARRGRGGSEGQYDEGFAPGSVGYACDLAFSLPGAERALRDVEAAMDAVRAFPFVDPTRVVIGGQSRGGILSVAYAGRRPEQVKGVINFVGGWMGAGCSRATGINPALFTRGARYPARRCGSTATATTSTRSRTVARTSRRFRRPGAGAPFTSCRSAPVATTSGGNRARGWRSSRPI